MLPLCFGEATKFSQFLLESDKCYQVTIKLGVQTTTGDAEGEIIATHPVNAISSEELSRVLEQFEGTIQQIPPMFSAIKVQGRPLYELARKGIEIDRQPRTVQIHRMRLLSFAQDSLELDIYCSKGTYIRSLVESMGEFIGCGAHVVALRRTWVDPFQSHRMMSLNDLEQCSFDERALHLLSISELLKKFMPSLEVSSHQGQAILKGQSIDGDFDFQAADCVCLLCEGRFLGIGEITEGHLKPKRLVSSI